jgi:hypothetical protein
MELNVSVYKIQKKKFGFGFRFLIFLLVAIPLDITATNGPKFSMLMLLLISKNAAFSIKK